MGAVFFETGTLRRTLPQSGKHHGFDSRDPPVDYGGKFFARGRSFYEGVRLERVFESETEEPERLGTYEIIEIPEGFGRTFGISVGLCGFHFLFRVSEGRTDRGERSDGEVVVRDFVAF